MSNLVKLEFEALDITGLNYLSWVLDAEIHLDAKNLGDTIKESNETSIQDKAKAMIFLRHHLHEGLKIEYLTIKDPADLWKSLKERYDHQKTIILPMARNEWNTLRFQDFKSVSEYNSAMFRISSKLKLCGDKITDIDMLEKTFSTFHASNIILQQQYRERGFLKYSDLISCLLLAEKNNELLMKNHESRPTGSNPFPEVNAIQSNHGPHHGRGHGPSHGQGPSNGHGPVRGRGHGRRHYGRGRGRRFQPYYNKINKEGKHGKDNVDKDQKVDGCFRCGRKGHWARTCRTPKHFVDLYQETKKGKGKNIETNFITSDSDDLPYGLNEVTPMDEDDVMINQEGGNDCQEI